MERSEIDFQLDQLRSRIEELSQMIDQNAKDLQDIRGMLMETRIPESSEVRYVASAPGPRKMSGRLLLLAGMTALSATVVAFMLFRPHAHRKTSSPACENMSSLMGPRLLEGLRGIWKQSQETIKTS